MEAYQIILILVGLLLFLFLSAIFSSIKKAEKARNKIEDKKNDMDYKNRKMEIRNRELEYKENKMKLESLRYKKKQSSYEKYSISSYTDYYEEPWQQEKINYENEYFFDLRKPFNEEWKDNVCGIYIIYNKTKHKYYVGQSSNIYKRVLKQHFSNEYAITKWFHKDWYNEDEFYWRYIEYPKNELNYREKHYISMYKSFEDGYNKTIGNS